MPCCAVWMPKRIGCRVMSPPSGEDPTTGGRREATSRPAEPGAVPDRGDVRAHELHGVDDGQRDDADGDGVLGEALPALVTAEPGLRGRGLHPRADGSNFDAVRAPGKHDDTCATGVARRAAAARG